MFSVNFAASLKPAAYRHCHRLERLRGVAMEERRRQQLDLLALMGSADLLDPTSREEIVKLLKLLISECISTARAQSQKANDEQNHR
jgi:hypothetical protein